MNICLRFSTLLLVFYVTFIAIRGIRWAQHWQDGLDTFSMEGQIEVVNRIFSAFSILLLPQFAVYGHGRADSGGELSTFMRFTVFKVDGVG